MRALVTGAGGFVGRHLVEHLEAAGDDVIGIDRTGPSGVDCLDAEPLAAALDAARPEVVYHLAGWSHVGSSWGSPREAFRANAEGTLNLLEAARGAGVRRVLLTSSAEVYGVVAPERLPITEAFPLLPASPYGASKVAAEFLALQAHLAGRLETVRVRSFNALGPGQAPTFLAPSIARQVALLERDPGAGDVVRVGNLDVRRDLVDVRDVARAYRLVMASGRSGEVYNVCSGVDASIAQVAEGLLALSTRALRAEYDPALARPVDQPVLRGDPGRLREATGWRPEIPLERTLQDLLAWWREELSVGAGR